MPEQIESSTTLNAGSGGDAIRDLTITPPGTGTPVKQQVVTLGDPTQGDNLAAISLNGELYIRAEDLISVNRSMLRELRRIRLTLGLLADNMSEEDEFNEEDF